MLAFPLARSLGFRVHAKVHHLLSRTRFFCCCCLTVVLSCVGRCAHPDAWRSPGGDGSTVTFYAISEDIDLRTGLDRRSGAQLEFWVTQISSLDRARIVGNAAFQAHFRSRGLALDEHVDARRARRRG